MKNKLLIGAVILVLGASIAYAAFAQLLTVSGKGTVTGEWNVAITGITRTSGTGATDATSTPSFTATTATFDVGLAYPGATATYDVTIKNNGTIPAAISDITGVTEANAAAPTYLTYTLTGVSAGTKLAAGATNTATVTVTWNSNGTNSVNGATKTASINFNYAQDTP